MIKLKDRVRVQIISRKVNKKNLNEKGLEDLKALYYSYLIYFYTHEHKFFENAQSYKAIYDTLKSEEEFAKKAPQTTDFGFSLNPTNLLENYVLYLVLNKHTNDQVQHLLELKNKYASDLEQHPHLRTIVENYLCTELITVNINDYNVNHCELFDKSRNEYAQQHLDNFRKQLVQHNIRIISLYYDRISMNRLSNLVAVGQDEVEAELCEMINNKLCVAKIDRPAGIINLKAKQGENEVLNDWRFDIHKILDLVDYTTNLINREYDVEKKGGNRG